MAWGQGSPEQVELSNPWMHLLYPVVCWGGIVAVLGFARGSELETAALAYLNGAMFTLLHRPHQPALFLLMFKVKTLWPAPWRRVRDGPSRHGRDPRPRL